jgi:membrane-associated phospholipid phosphatase
MDGYTRTPRRWWLRLVVAAGVLVVATAIALDGTPGWDERLLREVHARPDWVGLVLWAPMQLGTAFAPGIVAAVSWVAWGRWRPSVGAIVAGFTGWWLAQVGKELIDRGRPHDVLVDLERRTGVPHDGLGFPSGHATVVFALASVVSPYLTRRQRAIAYGLAVAVGVARVHLGAHFPLDVMGGAALGYLIGWIWNLSVGVPSEPSRTTESPQVSGATGP